MSPIVIGSRIVQVGIVVVLDLALAVLIFERDVSQRLLERVIRLHRNPVVKATPDFSLYAVVTEASGVREYFIDEDIRIRNNRHAAIQPIEKIKLSERPDSACLDERKNRSLIVEESAAD